MWDVLSGIWIQRFSGWGTPRHPLAWVPPAKSIAFPRTTPPPLEEVMAAVSKRHVGSVLPEEAGCPTPCPSQLNVSSWFLQALLEIMAQTQFKEWGPAAAETVGHLDLDFIEFHWMSQNNAAFAEISVNSSLWILLCRIKCKIRANGPLWPGPVYSWSPFTKAYEIRRKNLL